MARELASHLRLKEYSDEGNTVVTEHTNESEVARELASHLRLKEYSDEGEYCGY